MGYDARRDLDLEEEEVGVEDLDIPYYDTLPDPDLPDEEMQTSWAEDLEKRMATNRAQRRQRRAGEGKHQDGVKSRTNHHRMMPVEERNAVSIDALENPSEGSSRVPGIFGLGQLSLEDRIAWVEEHGGGGVDAHSGIGHFTDEISPGRNGIVLLKEDLAKRIAENKENLQRGIGTDFQRAQNAHAEALLEWLEDKTPEELYDAVLKLSLIHI